MLEFLVIASLATLAITVYVGIWEFLDEHSKTIHKFMDWALKKLSL